jgi:hypothetical protein
MSPRPLPRNPNLKLINAEARRLLEDFRQGDPRALARYSRLDARADRSNLRLADAQRVIAHEYGFASWLKLKQYVESMTRNSDSSEELEGL